MDERKLRPDLLTIVSGIATLVGVVGIIAGCAILGLAAVASAWTTPTSTNPSLIVAAAIAILGVSILELVIGRAARNHDHKSWVLGIIAQIAAVTLLATLSLLDGPNQFPVESAHVTFDSGQVLAVALLFPVLCLLYLVSPTGRSEFEVRVRRAKGGS